MSQMRMRKDRCLFFASVPSLIVLESYSQNKNERITTYNDVMMARDPHVDRMETTVATTWKMSVSAVLKVILDSERFGPFLLAVVGGSTCCR